MMRNAIAVASSGHPWFESLLGLGLLSILALAVAAQPAASLRAACGSDVRTVCAGVMPGGGRIKQCMIDKHDQLSKACKDALAARAADEKK
jgi:hypothetical protein